MKVVLDTNVLVSGLLSPGGAPGEIVRMIVSGNIEIIYDARIICEYEEVLKRPKFKIEKAYVDDIVSFIEHFGRAAAGVPLKSRLPDIDDEVFLETAVSAKADFLITGNIGHFPAASRQGVMVVTPSEFVGVFRGRKQK
ncbi:MAG: putative toxin-antitoxin system toxin component, PIN family [Candidatus Omnitrophota bacterium]